MIPSTTLTITKTYKSQHHTQPYWNYGRHHSYTPFTSRPSSLRLIPKTKGQTPGALHFTYDPTVSTGKRSPCTKGHIPSILSTVVALKTVEWLLKYYWCQTD